MKNTNAKTCSVCRCLLSLLFCRHVHTPRVRSTYCACVVQTLFNPFHETTSVIVVFFFTSSSWQLPSSP